MTKIKYHLSKRQFRRRVSQRVSAVINALRQPKGKNIVLSQVGLPTSDHGHISELTLNFNTSDEWSTTEITLNTTSTKAIKVSVQKNTGTTEDIKEQLRIWSLNNNVSQIATSELLKILKSHECFRTLPADSRSLRKTQRVFQSRIVKPGNYVHLGFTNGLTAEISKLENIPKVISVLVNVDGIPISNSSKSEFWPVLCMLDSPSFVKKPFCVGIYHGVGKPENQNEFLTDFVAEVKQLQTSGFDYQGQKIGFEIKGFICDSPARAFITCTKYHAGYSSCGKCTQVGERYQNRTVFSSKLASKRTGDSFSNQVDEDHHRGTTILSELKLDLVQKVPFEFMHLICLGVTRKLLNLWVFGKPKYHKFSGHVISNLSRDLVKQRFLTPSEFNRKPRSLIELARWKATEYRQFLLYIGPVILQNYIPAKYFYHFTSLHLAVFILSNDELLNRHRKYANSLLEFFVQQFTSLYGKENLSYNIHGLLHVEDDVKNFGNLNRYSAFPFENHLGQIKNLVKGGNRPLSQVCRRICERERYRGTPSTQRNKNVNQSRNFAPLLPGLISPQYQKITFGSSFLQSDSKNCYCLLKTGELIKIVNFATRENDQSLCVVGRLCRDLLPLYTVPCDSREFGIYKFKRLGDLKVWEAGIISQKYFVVREGGNSFGAFPLYI